MRTTPAQHAPASHSPALWTHSFFGSPRPAETLLAAVRRCAERDLGIQTFEIAPLLPTLSNHTLVSGGTIAEIGSVDMQGSVEVHPSYLVTTNEKPQPGDGFEIRWCEPEELGKLARQKPLEYSPLLSLHAVHVPFFGGIDHSNHPAIRHQKRAIG